MTGSERNTKPPAAGPGARPGRALRRVLRCRKGFTAAEFALSSIPVLMLFAAAGEIGWQMAASAALDYGANRATRFVSTGAANIPGAGTSAPRCRYELIPDLVSKATNGFLKKERLTYGATSYANYESYAKGQGGLTGAGSGGQTVSYALTYSQPYLFPEVIKQFFPNLANKDQARTHSVTLVAKNEPFTDANC